MSNQRGNCMKTKILNLILLFACQLAMASEMGTGSSGGGQGKDGVIRDLNPFEKMDCYRGKKFLNKIEQMEDFKLYLAKTNIAFFTHLYYHMASADYCLINTEFNSDVINQIKSQNGVTTPPSGFDQFAVKVNLGSERIVYISEPEWQKMDSLNRISLLIHEAGHDFIQFKDNISYYTRLRGFTQFVSNSYSQNVPAEEFNETLEENKSFLKFKVLQKPVMSFTEESGTTSFVLELLKSKEELSAFLKSADDVSGLVDFKKYISNMQSPLIEDLIQDSLCLNLKKNDECLPVFQKSDVLGILLHSTPEKAGDVFLTLLEKAQIPLDFKFDHTEKHVIYEGSFFVNKLVTQSRYLTTIIFQAIMKNDQYFKAFFEKIKPLLNQEQINEIKVIGQDYYKYSRQKRQTDNLPISYTAVSKW